MRLTIIIALSTLVAACGDIGPYEDHDEASDFDDVPNDGDGKSDAAGIPSVFDRNLVMEDTAFTRPLMDAAAIQRFFEQNPYGTRSWLADATVNGVTAAEAIVAAAEAEGLNPLVLVVRMQVEKSLVSKTVRPSSSTVDYAFGCGCPDGRSCNTAYRGLDKQLACAARTLRKWYDGSIDGSGLWVKGVAKRTLDPLSVTPRSHATASLYAYTPWVLVGSGGTWLVWNVTRKYFRHADALGLLDL